MPDGNLRQSHFPIDRPTFGLISIAAKRRRKFLHNLDQFEIAEGGQCYTGGADYYLALGNSLVHLQNGNPVVEFGSMSFLVAGIQCWRELASFAVCAALRRYGLFELHGAGVVEPGSEKGVLIIGPSGSGKSTLALQLAMSGWPYLSDDELLLSLNEGTVEARGFRSFFAVRDESNGDFETCFEPEAALGSKRRSERSARCLAFY